MKSSPRRATNFNFHILLKNVSDSARVDLVFRSQVPASVLVRFFEHPGAWFVVPLRMKSQDLRLLVQSGGRSDLIF